jgi:hypothetical protein
MRLVQTVLSNVLNSKYIKTVEILQTGIVTKISTKLEGTIIVTSKIESNDIYKAHFSKL